MESAKNANKTHPTNVDVQGFLATVDTSEVRRTDAHILLEIMREETGQEPRMWGPSIIGFGEYHYKYASGHEGDAVAAGFSPRKANLVIYGLSYPPGLEHLLEKLGKFKASVACIYVNKLADIDLDVLRELIRTSYRHITAADMQSFQSHKEQPQKG